MSFKNVYVLDKSGNIYLSRNIRGEQLDQSLVLGFASSLSSFCKTLVREPVQEVTTTHGRIIYREIGEFLFMVHADLKLGSVLVHNVLRDVVSMCELLFGPPEIWDRDTFDLSGIQDIISMYVSRPLSSSSSNVSEVAVTQAPAPGTLPITIANIQPTILSGGLSKIALPAESSDRLDKLLSVLESTDGVCGTGTMITLGGSVVHSRMPVKETRMILQYLTCRPLGSASVRYVPMYCNGVWRNVYFVRVFSYILTIQAFIDRSYTSLVKKVDEFSSALSQSRLELPTEEPPVQIRLFAKRETLAMLYSDLKTGRTLFPLLRPGPDVLQKEILDAFWGFYSDASVSLSNPGVSEVSIVKEAYRFYARSDGVKRLYLLLANESDGGVDVNVISTDILKAIKNY